MIIVQARKELYGNVDTRDGTLQKQEQFNASLRKRILWLIPFNFAVIIGTLKYCSNIHSIAAKFWPNLRKVRISYLFIVATMQSVGFTSIYLGGTFAILGINPITKYRELKEMSNKLENLTGDNLVNENGEINMDEFEKLSDGQKSMIKGLNNLGISNKTILAIEKEMRS